MLKVKNFFITLAAIVLFSSVSEARVCFLVGSDDEEGCLTATYEIESLKCKGFSLCESPRKGSSVCIDAGNNYYKPEDCCSNTEFYEPCNGDGMVCEGSVCKSSGENGEDVIWCEIGQCKCDDSYSETCDPSQGLEGVGDPCGGKYKSCRCGSSYYQCDNSATGSGSTCQDDRGTLYSSCTCPTAGENGWVTDPDECCNGYSNTCTTQPGGQVVYKCRTTNLPECVCGYVFSPSKQACVTGCTDDGYAYKGELPANATCTGSVAALSEGFVCANSCQCNDGYWDFVETCTKQNDNVCEVLGYVDTTCEGDWVACPYDVSAKKCLHIGKNTGEGEGGEGDSAVCPEGYSADKTQVSDCGDSGAKGWLFESQTVGDTLVCGKCTAKTCEEGSKPGGVCIAPKVGIVVGYAGDKKCVKCGSCSEGYASDAKYCGAGYTLGTKKDANGCYECVAKDCPEGSSTSTSCSGNAIAVATGSYSGASACYKCNTCTDNHAVSVTLCGQSGVAGWKLSDTEKDSSGCNKCIENACPAGSAVNKQCGDGEVQSMAGYSGNSRCYKCVERSCPSGQYSTKAKCEAAVGATCQKVLGSECWQKALTPAPCSDYTPGTCGYCSCMGKDYVCNGTCSDVDQKGPGGASICIACSPTIGGSTVGGGTTGGGGGGSIDNNPCIGPGDNSCECILYKDRFFCNNHPDNVCCDTVEKEDSTDTGITINP